ncbi:hypothetical protein [Phytohabitans houttuyneae]|uniref:Uncharacterized protein n=1 Tax=Phytohabitans houttuyneae TaxID=1076126 RepID=A0A6V8KIL7_9ACTN|nr:hypothetical protein [Phytohabitans houttuyneae]GFJ85042.1 hypothetical protein Phou_092220 [Phytohabitans houttuyneae]
MLLQIVGNPGGGSFRELTLYRHLKRDGDYSRAAITLNGTTQAGDPSFTAQGYTVRPYYISDTQPVSSYFRRVEPTIVFGSIDTGVPNRKRNDGLPAYDVPVTGIPSPGSDGPTFLDLVWDKAPFANHGAFVAAVTGTAEAFVAAGVFSAAEKDVVVARAAGAAQELAPPVTWAVDIQARAQCVGTSAYVSVNVRNTDEVPLTVELVTPYGSRTVSGVAPGKAAYQSFNARRATVPAGTVTVKVTGTVDGTAVTAQYDAPYEAGGCATA